MKNIRILEDGNRLIVVLEGYEKSAVNALMEMLETTATPLSHIKPHTGEAEFRLKGTEREVRLPKRIHEPEPETPIRPPAFMEQLQLADHSSKAEPAASAKQVGKAAKPAKQASGCISGTQKRDEEASAPPEMPDGSMSVPGYGMDEDAGNMAETESSAKTSETVKTEKTIPPVHGIAAGAGIAGKPAEFMNSFELRAYIRQADKEKLSALLRRKGRFPNAMHLLNSDDRTIRKYVKELLLTA